MSFEGSAHFGKAWGYGIFHAMAPSVRAIAAQQGAFENW